MTEPNDVAPNKDSMSGLLRTALTKIPILWYGVGVAFLAAVAKYAIDKLGSPKEVLIAVIVVLALLVVIRGVAEVAPAVWKKAGKVMVYFLTALLMLVVCIVVMILFWQDLKNAIAGTTPPPVSASPAPPVATSPPRTVEDAEAPGPATRPADCQAVAGHACECPGGSQGTQRCDSGVPKCDCQAPKVPLPTCSAQTLGHAYKQLKCAGHGSGQATISIDANGMSTVNNHGLTADCIAKVPKSGFSGGPCKGTLTLTW